MIISLIIILFLFILMTALQYINKRKKNVIYRNTLIYLVIALILLVINNYSYPELKLLGKKEINLSLNEKYIDPGYKIVPSNKKYKVVIDNNIDENKTGSYEVKYSLQVKNKIINKVRKVNVIDNISPEITLKGSDNIKLYESSDYEEPGFIAFDNYDGDITKNVIVQNDIKEEIGDYKITYIVEDSSGNKTMVTRNVKILDKKKNIGTIYLTFDDGPSNNTSKILDILKQEDIKATFFLVNFNSSYNPVVKRIYDEGHSIGIHSYTHNYKLIYSSVSAYFDDLNKMNDKIKTITGSDTKLLRFPGGSSNTISSFNKGIMTTLVKEVTNAGYHYFDWNVDSSDAWSARNSNDVYNNVINNLKKGTNIVLMHDLSSNEKTVNVLEKIIKDAKEKGYIFANITMNTKEIHHGINN
ncbi:MAG: polysaccharide deacetylase [bacterium]|nr:polysaccharide deacetylase [bacterium]MDY4109075.1 polysaccharide deacetylase [Bacilli bacterium]